MAQKKNFEEVNTTHGRRVIDQIEKAADIAAEEEKPRTRTSLVLDSDLYEYAKEIGAKREGSIVAYIEMLIKEDREAWKENEEALKEILSRKKKRK